MTKVEAIAKLMEDNGGAASLQYIYDNITKYYPTAKASEAWQEGLRGVLYRDTKNKKRFKKIGLSIYALEDYQEEVKPHKDDSVKMHSYIEGICVELGNLNDYYTYTADPSAIYRENLPLQDFASLHELPKFSYEEITNEAKRIDVIWFNKKGLAFPKKVFEVVDSIGTMNGAFNRSLQLRNFMTKFYIVAPEKHHGKFLQTIELEVYREQKERFRFINYDDITAYYESALRTNRLVTQLFG